MLTHFPAAREEIEEAEASAERRRARRERHERHKRERSGEIPRPEPPERSSHRRHRERGERIRERERESHSESDSTDDDSYEGERPKMLEPAPKAVMSGGLGDAGVAQAGLGGMGSLRENPDVPGQYIGYTRNPPPPTSLAATVGSGRKDSGR